MSFLFRTTNIKGNRLTEFAQTSATVGTVIPWGYGTFVVTGNVIWANLPPRTIAKKKKQGKGGVSQTTYHYTLSYAVAFSVGPIYKFLWIKRNGKVVYTSDPSAPISDKNYATKWLRRATLYTGGPDQLPDSTIESVEGVGNVSAHKNLSFIVLENDDVTESSGAPPTYEACVVATPPEAYLTSRPYPLLDTSAFRTDPGITEGRFRDLLITDGMEDAARTVLAFPGATLKSAYIERPLSDGVSTELGFPGATLKNSQVDYTDWAPDEVETTLGFPGANLKVALVTYEPPEHDAATTTLEFPGASLYVP